VLNLAVEVMLEVYWT